MKPEIIAQVRFTAPKGKWKLPSKKRYSGLCRFIGEETEAPYGKWTILMEFWELPAFDEDVRASVQMLSEGAPVLRKGMLFTMFEGPYVIGYGKIVIALERTDGRRDRGLGSPDISPIFGGM